MARRLLSRAKLVAFVLLLSLVGTTAADVGPEPPRRSAPPEQITGTEVVPVPSDQPAPRDPFTPYDTGPGVWTYRDLSKAEQQAVDRSKAAGATHAKANAAFAAAAAERAHEAAAEAAAIRLGIDNLLRTGVVQ